MLTGALFPTTSAQSAKERAALNAHAQAYLTARMPATPKPWRPCVENGARIGYDGVRTEGRAAVEALYTATFKAVTFVGGSIAARPYHAARTMCW